MKDKDIGNLLKQADGTCQPDTISPDTIIYNVRRKADQRHNRKVYSITIMVFLIFTGLGSWQYMSVRNQMLNGRKRIAQLESQVGKLDTKTDSTLDLIDRTLQQQQRLNDYLQMKAQLAKMEDPFEKINKQLDRTAEIKISYADRLYYDNNQKRLALIEYKKVINSMPDSKWAKIAQQRINEIRPQKAGKRGSI